MTRNSRFRPGFSRLSSRNLARVAGHSDGRRRPADRRSPDPGLTLGDAQSTGFPPGAVAPSRTRSDVDARHAHNDPLLRRALLTREEISTQGMHQPVVTSQGPAGVDLSPGAQRGGFRGTAQTLVSSSGRDRGGSDASPDLRNPITPLRTKSIRLFRIFSPASLGSRPADDYTTELV